MLYEKAMHREPAKTPFSQSAPLDEAPAEPASVKVASVKVPLSKPLRFKVYNLLTLSLFACIIGDIIVGTWRSGPKPLEMVYAAGFALVFAFLWRWHAAIPTDYVQADSEGLHLRQFSQPQTLRWTEIGRYGIEDDVMFLVDSTRTYIVMQIDLTSKPYTNGWTKKSRDEFLAFVLGKLKEFNIEWTSLYADETATPDAKTE